MTGKLLCTLNHDESNLLHSEIINMVNYQTNGNYSLVESAIVKDLIFTNFDLEIIW